MIEYECEKCGHVWKTEPPLFTIVRFCEIQGCGGSACPVDEDGVSPGGIEKM